MSHQGRKNADEVLLQALACGATQEQAAAKAGVSRSTVTRRTANPKFRRRLAAIKADIVCRTGAALMAAGTQAVKKLLALLESGPPTVQLGAARAILELGMRVREAGEFEARRAELEERLEQRDQRESFRLVG